MGCLPRSRNPRHRPFSASRRSAMAKLNRNSVLCNVAVDDNVVAGRMDIGSQRANMQAAAILPQGKPACAGLEPTPAVRVVWALVSSDYADTSRGRTGR